MGPMGKVCMLGLAAAMLTGCMPRLARYDGDQGPQPAPLPGAPPPGVTAATPLASDRLEAFIHRRNPVLSADRVAYLAQRIRYWGDRDHVDPRLIAALVAVESSFDATSRSVDGALGLGQLMPDTAKDLGVQDPLDADQNLMGTCRYLADLLDQWHDVRLAVASYNAGPVGIKRELAAGGLVPEVRQYVDAVMNQYQQLAG